MIRSLARPAIPCLLAAALPACASISVNKTQTLVPDPPRTRPQKIFVRPFAFHEDKLRADRSGRELEAFRERVSSHLASSLAARLTRTVAPAEVVARDARLPTGNYWAVEGEITRLHQGSRLLRSVVGLGAGGTKLETRSRVEDLSKRPPAEFLLVETTGGSNVSPGVLGTAGFFVSGVTSLFSLVNVVEGARTGVSFDVVRTAKEISAASSEFLYQQRAIAREEALAPKRPGRWSPDFWPFRRLPEKLPEGRVTVEAAE